MKHEGPEKKGVVRYANTESFGFRIKAQLRAELDLIAEYEGAQSPSDLARTWVREKISGYRADRRYQQWVDRKHPRPKEMEPGQVALA